MLLVAAFIAGYTPDTDPAAMKAKYASGASQFLTLAPGLSVHVRDEGQRDGRALVLIHGANASLHTWERWVSTLGGKYRLITLDLPGHGLTGTHPSGAYTYEVFVDVVDSVMQTLGVSRAVIGGNSMGGGVAWQYALRHPRKVDGLLLTDSIGAPQNGPRSLPLGIRLARAPVIGGLFKFITPRSMVHSSLQRSFHDPAVVTDAMSDRYWELNRYPGNRDATMRRIAAGDQGITDAKDQIATIRTPVLILWGDDDRVFPVQSAQWFSATIPGAKVVTYPDIGHMPMEENPDRSAADVAAWLNNIVSRKWMDR